MTAKRSPLDFIINDSSARSDKQKAREYSAAHSMSRCTANVLAYHWGHISGANWRVGHKRDSYLNTSFFNNDREEREERKGKEDKDLKGGCKFSWMF